MNGQAALLEGKPIQNRFERIKQTLLGSPVWLCPERALLVTEFFKKFDNPKEPMVIRKAKALRHLLRNKTVRIYDDELIVGNPGTKRKSIILQPELASVFMCEELLWMDRRKTTPLSISWPDRFKLLLTVIPYWLLRNMSYRAFTGRMLHLMRYVREQLCATAYLINEAGGIGHFLPDYEKMISRGIRGYLDSMGDMHGDLHEAARIACDGLADFALRLSHEAQNRASMEPVPERAQELREISRICAKVPMEPAETLQEALQSLWLTHMAVCLEGLNSAVSLGRIDQYLLPYFRKDLAENRLTREQALELLLCFSAKTTEHLFLLSSRTSEYHGGYLVAQAATVGGMDMNGNDAVNELTHLFLDVMEQAGLRDPNYMARIHDNSPEDYVERAVEVACRGNAVPGLFNDEITIASLVAHGYTEYEARNFGVVGCVEPTIPGKSFCSTDAALFNLPLCLILALNKGRRLGSRRRFGITTPDPATFTGMDDILHAFRIQVDFMVSRMIKDLQVIEQGNRDYHPTPFSSMLVDGCLQKGTDVTAGGARYNSSGIQGVGVADVADSLAALDEVVFTKQVSTILEVIRALEENFTLSPKLHAELLKAPKFGNDHDLPDFYAARVVQIYHDSLSRHTSTRGGPYLPGFYSSTCHVGFGNRTEALPSGRKTGEPFAASLGCCNSRDRLGPTALLNSVAKIDSTLSPNGYALNLRFDTASLQGEQAKPVMTSLIKGFFSQGGMEMQLNVLDPEILEQARDNPGRYPGIVVRVAGYCAYFDELPLSVKNEIISRTRIGLA
ncbi:MAG: pyruvate formate lyase family protein [Desulfomonilia bacterium]|nr:pyruvate formate lyase family protein [Desulfomonilia bacterium]